MKMLIKWGQSTVIIILNFLNNTLNVAKFINTLHADTARDVISGYVLDPSMTRHSQ